MSTLSVEEQDAIHRFVMEHRLSVGLGSNEEACSIAAINLALSGELTDTVPDCMSEVIGLWIINVQDRMPDGLRNDFSWKSLLPFAAGTGRDERAERIRLARLHEWIWNKVLPALSPIAERDGVGELWGVMLKKKTGRAAWETMVRARGSELSEVAAIAGWESEGPVSNRFLRLDTVARTARTAAISARVLGRSVDADIWNETSQRAYDHAWIHFAPADLLKQLIEA